MFKLALGGISIAPNQDKASSVLDLGCGTGIWSCQFAESHSSAQVLGVDIVPPTAPPGGRLVPPNCTFVQANVEDDWEFAVSRTFDFIYARLLIAGLKDWSRLFDRVYQHLSPGGIFELYEGVIIIAADDNTTSKDSAIMRWYEQLRHFVGARGVNPDAPVTFTELLQHRGFKMLEDRKIKTYLDPHKAAAHTTNGSKVATELTSDLRRLINNMTDKVFKAEDQRRLASEALEDLSQNSGSRGYHCVQ